MKKIVILTLSSIFLFPVVALAQQPYARYGNEADCKSGGVPKGVFLYPTGVDEKTIGVIVDPAFNEKMKKERNTPDLPVTPIYDLIVEAVPTFGACYTETPEKFSTEPPTTLPFTVSIKLANETLVGPGTLSYQGRKTDSGSFLYDWKLAGWKDGITEEKKLEKLLDAVARNDPKLEIQVEVKKKNGTTETAVQKPGFSLCAPIWGSGRHIMVGQYGDGSVGASERVAHFDTVRLDGFASTEPFAAYQSAFSYLVDLTTREGSAYDDFLDLASRFEKEFLSSRFVPAGKGGESSDTRISDADKIRLGHSALGLFLEDSACGREGVQLFTVDDEYDGGSALLNDPRPGPRGVRGAIVGDGQPPWVYVHETGHTFAQLADEYPYTIDAETAVNIATEDFAPWWQFFLTNCSTAPVYDYRFGGKLYGETNIKGCTFTKYTTGNKDEFFFYRPSSDSLMRGNESKVRQFNVVSCGWILAAIKGGDAKSHFPECAKMGGVVKDGVQASAFYPLFALLERAFAYPQEQKQTAVVGASSISGRNKYLIIESFNQKNPWGKIIKVVPDTNSPSTSTTVPSPTPVPPTSNDFVQTENIFDTVSLDVKVNGSDGPVSIQKGGRIAVSWISEGASRCRAMWSKNDIAKSGTIAGRLSRTGSFSIRAACVDSDGNRADDNVIVNVRE